MPTLNRDRKAQLLIYNTGIAIRPKNSRQDQFLDIMHGQGGDGEAQEALPRENGVQLCVTPLAVSRHPVDAT